LRNAPRIVDGVTRIEPEHGKTRCSQVGIAVGIVPLSLLGFVMIAIHLYDDLRIEADKVANVRAKRRLTAKLQSGRLQVA
jgi:hypothetical protein